MTIGGIIRSFVISKPPNVVFVVCLLAFGITTLSLSVFVNNNKQIPNPDVLGWDSLMKRLSTLEFCLQREANVSEISKVSLQNHTEVVAVSVPLLLQVDPQVLVSLKDTTIFALGEVPFSKLGRHLARYEGQKLRIGFDVNGNARNEICMLIEGPRQVLSDMNSGLGPQNCSASFRENVTALNLKHHSQDEAVPITWCSFNDIPLAFEAIDQPEWTVFVSEHDKELIEMHLMVTSVFIFVLLVTIIAVIILRNATALCRGGYSPTGSSEEENFLSESSLDQA